MKNLYVMFACAVIYIAASAYTGEVIETTAFNMPDTCQQLLTLQFKHDGLVLWRGNVTAVELIESHWHIYMNGIDSLQIHRDSLLSMQMLY